MRQGIPMTADIPSLRRAVDTLHENRETTIELLQLCNNAHTVHELMRNLMRFFQRFTTCEAVGVRLREGDDYPYYELRGFSDEFSRAEKWLCATDREGMTVRDKEGKPVLGCLCGGVITGRLDDFRPFATPYGSFWANDRSPLPADMTEENHLVQPSNRCIKEGYESMALIPLRLHGKTLGLFQFNDRRKGLFSPELLELLENLVQYISIALTKLHALEESQRLNNELRTNGQALRNISLHLESLRENERKTIAREIHDEFGQSLTALKYHIASVRQNIANPVENQVYAQLAAMDQIVEAGMNKIQKISSHLRPEILDDLGLAAAIEWQAKGLQQFSGITFHLDLKAETYPSLPQETAIAVFRIFQESLTNILRHSGATHVEISLDHHDDRLCLHIADNGRGITADELSSPSSYGILGMAERARSCPEGSLEIKRGIPSGTVVELSLRCAESVGANNIVPHEARP